MPEPMNQVSPVKPTFDTHKVFAAIGIILTVTIFAIAALWYFTDTNKGAGVEEDVKVTTSSAKPATNSATTSAE